MLIFHTAALAVLMLLTGLSVTQAQDLSLTEAVNLSLAHNEPSVRSYHARAETIWAASQSQSQLMGPKAKLGLANLPANGFNFTQEPMTQLQIMLHQDIPGRTTRRLIREKGEHAGNIYQQQAIGQQLNIIRDVRRLWLQLLFTANSKIILLEKQRTLEELSQSLQGNYLAGKNHAGQLLLLDAERALLDDKQEQLAELENITRLKLARYIGSAAMASVPSGTYDQMTVPPALSQIEDSLPQHPALKQHRAKIRVEDKAIGLAHEAYKPNWGLDVGYGLRGGGRADLLTAMVTFDVPLFTRGKQDKKLYSAKKSKLAAQLSAKAATEDMKRNLKISYIKWQRSSRRLTLHETDILPRTKAAAQAAAKSYAAGSSGYDDMIRISLGALDVRQKIEELKMIRAQSQADLAYYSGEIQ